MEETISQADNLLSVNEVTPVVEVHPVPLSEPDTVQELVEETPYGMLNAEDMKRVHFLVKKSYRDILKDALVKNYVERGKHLVEHAVELAYKDSAVLIALLKKIVPDKADVAVDFKLSEEEYAELERLRGSISNTGVSRGD